MAKDTFYFSHDYNARNDPKIKKLIAKHGYEGYGIFWALVEELYNNANALPTDYETIAFDLRSNEQTIEQIIEDTGLFVINGDEFGSVSIQNRLDERDAKSEKARESARKRWDKLKDNANALQTQSDPNAIKESKVKKNKGKENKELIYPFDSEKFMTHWNLLIKESKWKRKSNSALQASLKKLSEYSEEVAIEAILDSISGNYQGIFPEKFKNNSYGTRKSTSEKPTDEQLLKAVLRQNGHNVD